MTASLAETDHRTLDDRFAVAGQVRVEHVPLIRDAGYTTIICNRPDNEAHDQTPSDAIAQAAREAGLAFHYVPVSPAGMTRDNVEQTKAILQAAQGRVFAYCRSGARSTNLYAMASAG